jgi:uncharacterized membrane protein
MNKARAESFSNGVFAFAITLLVLGIHVPELKTGSNAELREALIRSLPQLVPYVTSFATIGIIWLNHHAMFQGVERVEHTTFSIPFKKQWMMRNSRYLPAVRGMPCPWVRSEVTLATVR